MIKLFGTDPHQWSNTTYKPYEHHPTQKTYSSQEMAVKKERERINNLTESARADYERVHGL